jgi:hypothetical protein
MVLSGLGPTRTRPSVNIAAEGSHWKIPCVPRTALLDGFGLSVLRPRRSFSPPETSTLTSSASAGWFPEKPLTSSDSKYP